MSYIDWNIKTQDEAIVTSLSSSLGCSKIVSKLLINRGLTEVESAENFLNPRIQSVHNPYLLNDMEKAINRICKALDDKEKICIYGDYDVDGITSVSALYLYLKHFTNNIYYHIPDRFSQGYGVSENAIKKIADMGCTLIITVDTGISAFDEIKFASANNIDVVVTDHHECQSILPDAVAVVNPKRPDSLYPFSKLAGVGVVYKLISAIDIKLGITYADDYLDLVAIGTIADIMPLIDENRYIVKKGIEKMQTRPNMGLKSLVDMCLTSPTITAASIGFAVAPRINAAGRMSDAEIAVKLFITDDRCETNSIAEHLCKLNTERQKIENSIYNEAISIIEKQNLDQKYNALVLWSENWHSGVIGIVASRIKDKYNKPTVLFSIGDFAKGSGRSVAPFNLYKAFDDCRDLLLQFGGHKYAAGVLLETGRLHEFRDKLSESVCKLKNSATASKTIDIECELDYSEVMLATAEEISSLQPYGKNNDIPLFCIRNVKINDIFPTTNNKHLRIRFCINDKLITGFYFGVSPLNFDYREGDLVDIVCELTVNEYKNYTSVQLILRDMRYNQNTINSYHDKRTFCIDGNVILPMMLPTRADIAAVYRFLTLLYSKGKKTFNLDTITNMMKIDFLNTLNFEQIYFAVEVLLELGVLKGKIDDNELSINSVTEGIKVNLTDSARLMYIYEKAGVKFGDSN